MFLTSMPPHLDTALRSTPLTHEYHRAVQIDIVNVQAAKLIVNSRDVDSVQDRLIPRRQLLVVLLTVVYIPSTCTTVGTVGRCFGSLGRSTRLATFSLISMARQPIFPGPNYRHCAHSARRAKTPAVQLVHVTDNVIFLDLYDIS
jgi:hypothetical protein